MYKQYTTVKDWYLGLPWWWKILGVVVLVAIMVLGVLAWVTKLPVDNRSLSALDKLHSEQVDDSIKDLRAESEIVSAKIKRKKIETYTKLNQASKIDAKTIANREKIDEATSMEELDRLQRELGL